MFLVKRSKLFALFVAFVLILSGTKVFAGENHDQLFMYIGDSLMKAKTGDTEAVSDNIHLFEKEWKQIKVDSKLADVVDERMTDVEKGLEAGETPEELRAKLSALSTALINYDAEQNPVDMSTKKEKLRQIRKPRLQRHVAAARLTVVTGVRSRVSSSTTQPTASTNC